MTGLMHVLIQEVADLSRKLSTAEKRLANLEGAGAKIEKLQVRQSRD